MAIEQARESYLRSLSITLTEDALENGVAGKLETVLAPYAKELPNKASL